MVAEKVTLSDRSACQSSVGLQLLSDAEEGSPGAELTQDVENPVGDTGGGSIVKRQCHCPALGRDSLQQPSLPFQPPLGRLCRHDRLEQLAGPALCHSGTRRQNLGGATGRRGQGMWFH